MLEIFVAIAGVIIGAIVSAMAFLYQRRLDTLATLQVSLYRLLELYRSVKLSKLPSVEVQMDWYIDVANEIFPEEKIFEKKDSLKQVMGPIITAASGNISQESDDESLLSSYTDTISKLAPLAPLLAYRLGANTSLKKALGEMDEYHKNFKEILSSETSANDIETLNSIVSLVQTRATKDVIDELRRDILWVAFRCGVTPLLLLVYRFYVRREESIESMLKKEYRVVLQEIKLKAATN